MSDRSIRSAVFTLAIAGVAIVATSPEASASDDAVWICHATASAKNPHTLIRIDRHAWSDAKGGSTHFAHDGDFEATWVDSAPTCVPSDDSDDDADDDGGSDDNDSGDDDDSDDDTNDPPAPVACDDLVYIDGSGVEHRNEWMIGSVSALYSGTFRWTNDALAGDGATGLGEVQFDTAAYTGLGFAMTSPEVADTGTFTSDGMHLASWLENVGFDPNLFGGFVVFEATATTSGAHPCVATGALVFGAF